jgi:hypothetical protein
MPRFVSLLLGSALVAAPLAAQSNGQKKTPEQIKASFDAHKGDFDYLIGDWRFTAQSKQWGAMQGYWSAVKLATGSGAHILDEYRVVGDSGETYYVSSTLRAYNPVLDRWELVSTDEGSGLQDRGTARKAGSEMLVEQTFDVMSGEPSLWRIRYYDIRSDGFSWTADRSLDGGKTWEKNHMTIEAKRIGPPRSLPALAPPRKPAASP